MAIAGNGHLIKTMIRCFCLWQKRCAYGAMCASITLRIKIVIASGKKGTPRVHSVPRGPLFPRIFRFLEKLKKAHVPFIKTLLKTENLMDFWGSWQVLTRARTLAYVTEQGSAKTPKRRELSVFNRVDRFLSGYPKYRYKACEKCRGDAAQKDNSDLANSVT